MKKLLLFLLLATSIYASGQVYHPMLNDTKWNIHYSSFGFSANTWILPIKDTIVFSKTYTMYFDSSWNTGPYFVREDTAAKRVYRIKNNADTVLLDFSLNLGDSLRLGDNRVYKLISIDTFNVNGGSRRWFKLCTYNSFGYPLSYEDWLESVGNLSTPLRTKYELNSDPAFSINCNYQQGTVLFGYGLPNCPTAFPLSVERTKLELPQVTLFPNPFSTQLTFSLADNLPTTVSLYNFLGQQVLQQTFTNSTTINTEQLADGIYFYELRNSKGTLKTGKVVKQ